MLLHRDAPPPQSGRTVPPASYHRLVRPQSNQLYACPCGQPIHPAAASQIARRWPTTPAHASLTICTSKSLTWRRAKDAAPSAAVRTEAALDTRRRASPPNYACSRRCCPGHYCFLGSSGLAGSSGFLSSDMPAFSSCRGWQAVRGASRRSSQYGIPHSTGCGPPACPIWQTAS